MGNGSLNPDNVPIFINLALAPPGNSRFFLPFVDAIDIEDQRETWITGFKIDPNKTYALTLGAQIATPKFYISTDASNRDNTDGLEILSGSFPLNDGEEVIFKISDDLANSSESKSIFYFIPGYGSSFDITNAFGGLGENEGLRIPWIDELEPDRRGVYGGAIGYLSWTGNMDLAIAIRTAVIREKELSVRAGGGVVYDSDPEAEYQESLNKAQSIIKAIEDMD